MALRTCSGVRARCPTAWILLLVCAAAPAPALAQFPPDSFTNLRVLPQDIPARELVQMMAGFTRALGVRCTYCHVGSEDIPLEQYDFASDEKLAKRKARTMIRMLEAIEGTHLAELPERLSPPVRIECFTCHRGTAEPRRLEDMITAAYEAAGIDSAVAAYEGLREEFYGRAIYDFGSVALTEVAGPIAARGDLADAERLLELNVRMNPESEFARLQYVITALQRAFLEGGTAAGTSRHTELRARFGESAFPERVLLTVGAGLLRRQRVEEAVAAYRINVEAYPRSSSAHQELGNALAASGDSAGAIRSLERAVELDPTNAGATARLRELRGGGS